MQIGEVAQRVGLSLRTIRYYEEMGLVVPSARSAGGFRLYDENDVARLLLIKRMKPLDFSLEESRDLLEVLDDLEGASEDDRPALVERLALYHQAARERVTAVQEQLVVAEGFAQDLSRELQRQQRVARTTG